MKKFYLAAAIFGAVIPIVFFNQFFGNTQGAGLQDFISALFINGASGGFTVDLLISSFVFWAYMWSQRNTGPKPWLFMALNLGIGLSCALPAYLYVVERRKE